jgi:hypothetical protein
LIRAPSGTQLHRPGFDFALSHTLAQTNWKSDTPSMLPPCNQLATAPSALSQRHARRMHGRSA